MHMQSGTWVSAFVLSLSSSKFDKWEIHVNPSQLTVCLILKLTLLGLSMNLWTSFSQKKIVFSSFVLKLT